ncbi:MAG: hypothetical protein IPK80_14885 [Nannocystis sp.]|nr:hypothetical protein [Nannocystis sp.]
MALLELRAIASAKKGAPGFLRSLLTRPSAGLFWLFVPTIVLVRVDLKGTDVPDRTRGSAVRVTRGRAGARIQAGQREALPCSSGARSIQSKSASGRTPPLVPRAPALEPAPSPSPQKPLANPPKGDLFGEISHFFSSAHNRPILARAIALGVLLRHAGGIEPYASRFRAFAA